MTYLTGGSTQAEANPICLVGGDVYAAGFDDFGHVYWKNGVQLVLADDA